MAESRKVGGGAQGTREEMGVMVLRSSRLSVIPHYYQKFGVMEQRREREREREREGTGTTSAPGTSLHLLMSCVRVPHRRRCPSLSPDGGV